MRGRPLGCVGLLWRKSYALLFHLSRGFGDGYGPGGGFLDSRAAEIIGGRKAECAVGYHANAQSEGFGVRGAGDLAILRGQGPVAIVHCAHSRIRRPLESCEV